jgi:type VI secretion system secreted protein VgrG
LHFGVESADHYIATENIKHIVIASNFYVASNDYRASSSQESHYECSFTAIRATQPFRPKRITPVPFVQGPQTAMVVGKDGEEIWTDKYGRIKVQFHWEREGKKNETSSCWLRVAYPVAGKSWGWVSLPRIGQEVVVSFLEGNPDRPLITGSVYNGANMPPYDLPANQTQSGIKSRSSKSGVADNFNEIRFEDKKDSEEVYVHAEKDFNCIVENNETRQIGVVKKDKGDQTIEIQNDRTITLNEGNDTLHIKKGNRESNIDVGNHTLNVKQGNHLENVDQGNATLNVKQGNNNINISMGDYILKVDAGNAKITAVQSIELKVGGSSIKMDPSSITIKAPMITIQADGMLEAKSPMTTVKGDGMLTLKGGITLIN